MAQCATCWSACGADVAAAQPGGTRLIVLVLGEPFGDHDLRD